MATIRMLALFAAVATFARGADPSPEPFRGSGFFINLVRPNPTRLAECAAKTAVPSDEYPTSTATQIYIRIPCDDEGHAPEGYFLGSGAIC